jgi:hypothetical protein
MTKAAIHGIDWEILPHPPYSPDLAPIGVSPLPLSLHNLCGVSFNNDAELQNWLDDFFTAKPVDFFKRGIENLPEGWETVVSNGRKCIIN